MKGPRVIAGSAGGLFLTVPKHFPSRPTQDRVKQAIFSSLGGRVPGSRVLDLYAGTGALGIEALSRGADSCTFVESDARTVAALRANLAHCHLEGLVLQREASAYLHEAPEAAFGLILLDPPYQKEKTDLAASPLLPGLVRTAEPGALLVWEHDARNTWSAAPGLRLHKTVRYGETAVTYLIRE